MKKRVKQYAQQIQVGTQDRRHVLKDFSRMLDDQVCIQMHIGIETLVSLMFILVHIEQLLRSYLNLRLLYSWGYLELY